MVAGSTCPVGVVAPGVFLFDIGADGLEVSPEELSFGKGNALESEVCFGLLDELDVALAHLLNALGALVARDRAELRAPTFGLFGIDALDLALLVTLLDGAAGPVGGGG